MSQGSLSTLVMADKFMMMPVPDAWSLEDAATVMVVYSTVLYALKKVKDWQSVKIIITMIRCFRELILKKARVF